MSFLRMQESIIILFKAFFEEIPAFAIMPNLEKMYIILAIPATISMDITNEYIIFEVCVN
jgi:hypothetical protein